MEGLLRSLTGSGVSFDIQELIAESEIWYQGIRGNFRMDDKPFSVRSHDVHLDSAYREWFGEVKKRYRNAQIKAAVKVNAEQLLFNWQLGRDLVLYRAEEKWGKGVVEQVSLDLQDAFPDVKGFSARNLWFMKQWYSFYSSKPETTALILALDEKIYTDSRKLKQTASEIQDEKLKQFASEMPFPLVFAYVPWMKVKSFEPEFAGKLNFYINAVNELICTENDNPTIGLLICRDMDRTEVQWSLQGIETPIGVAVYSNIKIEEVQAQLPTTEEIKACVERAEEAYLLSKKESG